MGVPIKEKGVDFSMRIGELTRYLRENGKGFPFSDRLLDCGLSAGMLCSEGKNNEAMKYIGQAEYIIQIAVKAGYLTEQQSVHINADCKSLMKLLENGKG